MLRTSCFALAALAVLVSSANADSANGLTEGSPDIKSAGPLAFGPDGILFLGDPKAATIFAIDTGDAKGDPSKARLDVKAINQKVAAALDEDFDIEIVESHHRHKVDAPSGTALMLGEAAAEGRGVALKDVQDRGRDGITGARKMGDIGFAALRGGDVVGEHDVIFAADGERIVLRHLATDRRIFARGALKAALWGQDKKPGQYDMMDVLGL